MSEFIYLLIVLNAAVNQTNCRKTMSLGLYVSRCVFWRKVSTFSAAKQDSAEQYTARIMLPLQTLHVGDVKEMDKGLVT